jgi:hypothetical protein
MKAKTELTPKETKVITNEQSEKISKAEQEELQKLWEIKRKERKRTRIILYDKMNELEQALCVNLLQALDSYNNNGIEHPKDFDFIDSDESICLLEYKGEEYVINYHETEDNKRWVKNLKFNGNAWTFYKYRSAIEVNKYYKS